LLAKILKKVKHMHLLMQQLCCLFIYIKIIYSKQRR